MLMIMYENLNMEDMIKALETMAERIVGYETLFYREFIPEEEIAEKLRDVGIDANVIEG